MPTVKIIGLCIYCSHDFEEEEQTFECPKCGSESVIYSREMICDCGETIYLTDPLTNECSKCGKLFNSCGQELDPERAYGDGKVY